MIEFKFWLLNNKNVVMFANIYNTYQVGIVLIIAMSDSK
jgi:hypothetical protein